MAATQIQEMRHPHDAILDYILAHPFCTLRDLSNATTYSVPWLSQVIRSDVFQVEYEKRRGDLESAVMQPIRQRLEAVAHLAIDNLEEHLKKNANAEFALDAFDKVLHRAGFAPSKIVSPVAPQINNNIQFVVNRDELAQLRGQIIQGSVVDSTQSSPRDGDILPPPTSSPPLPLKGESENLLADLLTSNDDEPL